MHLALYSATFNFYGLRIHVHGNGEDTINKIKHDFSYFTSLTDQYDIVIETLNQKPDYRVLPSLKASIYTLDYVTYQNTKNIFTDYHNKGLRIFDKKSNHYKIYSDNAALTHEIAYLTILSAAGKYLDSKHIHRIHALGLSKNGNAVLILLPEKGGKSTLALQLINSGKIKLISEESPLLSSKGEILPFPLRMELVPEMRHSIPERFVYHAYFSRAGNKVLIDTDYCSELISQSYFPGIVLLGERILSNDCRIIPAGKTKAAGEFVKNSVIGLGLHQGMEYLLGGNIIEKLGKSTLVLSRLKNSLRVLRKSKVFRYQIGHDFENNANTLLNFLNTHCQK